MGADQRKREEFNTMARVYGPKCRICRREGVRLNLKGSKCESDKCVLSKRQYAPGQHGNSRSKQSGYAKQLREKQKAKRIYGLLEKQFRKYVEQAFNSKGITSEALMQRLESRLDNLVYKSGFAVSRPQARQYIRSGFFSVNDKVVKTPSQQLKTGDTLKPINFEKLHLREGFSLPEWITANVKEKYVKLERLPSLDEFSESFDLPLIIEFYSMK